MMWHFFVGQPRQGGHDSCLMPPHLSSTCGSVSLSAVSLSVGKQVPGPGGGQGESLVPPYTRGSVSLSLSLSHSLSRSRTLRAPQELEAARGGHGHPVGLAARARGRRARRRDIEECVRPLPRKQITFVGVGLERVDHAAGPFTNSLSTSPSESSRMARG